MFLPQVLSTLCLAALAHARAAPVSRDSPLLGVYSGSFGEGKVQGSVTLGSLAGFVFGYVRMTDMPYEEGPFEYYIADRQVPEGGVCDSLKAAFNPYDGVDNAPTWAEDMIGDLSGKHGRLKGSKYTTVFIDPYMSLNERNKAFVGDLGLVVQNSEATSTQCVNIEKIFGKSPIPQDVVEKAQELIEQWKAKNPN